MNRINGYIDLNNMINSREISATSMYSFGEKAMFNYNDNMYYFKKMEYSSPYSELLAEELAKDFHLHCAHYDLAVLNNQYGVISKDIHESGYKYVSGEQIINDYIKSDDYKAENYYNNVRTNENNLEMIWNALEYRYKDNPRKEEFIFSIMDKIVELFIFDIVTKQIDRNKGNFEIMESETYADLAPLYDNEGIVHDSVDKDFFRMSVELEASYSLFKELDKFIKLSDITYLERINRRLWVISPDNLNKKFKIIEERTNYPIDDNVKKEYLEKFEIHGQKLIELLDKYKEGNDNEKNRWIR